MLYFRFILNMYAIIIKNFLSSLIFLSYLSWFLQKSHKVIHTIYFLDLHKINVINMYIYTSL